MYPSRMRGEEDASSRRQRDGWLLQKTYSYTDGDPPSKGQSWGGFILQGTVNGEDSSGDSGGGGQGTW